MTLDVPEEIGCTFHEGRVRFEIDGISTDWMADDDSFIERIKRPNLNPVFLRDHARKEIEIRNVLDDGICFLKAEKYQKAIGCFDEVLFYDCSYGEALFNKSLCFKSQRHFVKALRHYKKAIKMDARFEDDEYYRELLKLANDERSDFPKLKLNIYAGDEYFSRGEFQKAVKSYDRALKDPSKFKDTILSKLLNKKGSALVKLKDYENALDCFKKSKSNDYSLFYQGFCEFNLGLDVNEKFRGLLRIDKGLMLKQAEVLKELGYFEQSLAVCDCLMENHFSVDDFYFRILKTKREARDNLSIDCSNVDEIISALF
jgi:tetratricopeptide (TPR) repeat protein